MSKFFGMKIVSRFLRPIAHWSFAVGHLIFLAASAHAQSGNWPFASPSPGATPRPFFSNTPASDEPAREVPLVEKKWDQLSDQRADALAQKALAIKPNDWKHAETDNFILHYRRVTEARKVAREVEYDLWFVAKTLGANKEQYKRKSHVFVFEDEAEWKDFLAQTTFPQWFGSFAHGDELFLNVRRMEGGRGFDSHTLAHETTHAVVARLYPRDNWPLWLNEGFAEYMGNASVAARKNQTVKGRERLLNFASLPLERLTGMTQYPQETVQVAQLYETSEKLVRFLMTEGGQERFPRFIDAMIAGKSLQDAVLELYGDRFKSWDDFMKKYERFSK